MKSICHLTSAHSSNDIRIFVKECCSLADNGYNVFLVAKGESRISNKVNIIGVGEQPQKRINRMLFFSRKIYRKSIDLDCDLYHFHDPELLPYALKLKKKGKVVIFDCHEDVSAQILGKQWIPKIYRAIISKLYKMYETFVVKRLDAVIAATPYIGDLFKNINSNVVVINNFPRLDDIYFQTKPFSERDKAVCYVGAISKIRGEEIMLKIAEDTDITLLLAGTTDDSEFLKKQLSGGGQYLIT